MLVTNDTENLTAYYIAQIQCLQCLCQSVRFPLGDCSIAAWCRIGICLATVSNEYLERQLISLGCKLTWQFTFFRWLLGIRKMPKITFGDFMLLLPIGEKHVALLSLHHDQYHSHIVNIFYHRSDTKCWRPCMCGDCYVPSWWWIIHTRHQGL